MLPLEGQPVLREGFFHFMEKNKDKSFVLTAHAPRDVARKDVFLVGFPEKIAIYGLEDAHKIFTNTYIPSKYKTLEERAEYVGKCVLSESSMIPQSYDALLPFREIACDTKISLTETAFIGSEKEDVEEAMLQRVGVVFSVPQFRDKKDNFSFENISLSPLTTFLPSLKRYLNLFYDIKKR